MGQVFLKKCTLGVLIALLVLLAFATIAEKLYGSEWTHLYIYGSWWFVLLWTILGFCSLLYITERRLYRQKAAFLLHVSFLIILFGALVTYLTAERGYMHIRQGDTADYYTAEDGETEHKLPFTVKLILFDIEYHPDADEPADYISFLKINDEVCRVSMNRIQRRASYRLYQMSYDRDEMGTLLMITRDPWGIGITYTGYALLALSMLWMLWLRIKWKGILYAAIAVACLWYYISQMNPMTPVLRSPMLAAHVSVIMISYVLLIAVTVISIIALCNKKLERKLYRWNNLLLYPALFLLAAGIFIGAIWANISWGRYWGWDAKETWALITMLIYALPMYKNSLRGFSKPKNFHIFCAVALLTVAMTFFGVTYFLGGIHSYV